MAIANWTLAQVVAQLDSGEKWAGSTITYSFPTFAGGLVSYGEAAGFRAFNSTQQSAMTLALATWDELIAPNTTLGTPGNTAIEFGYTSTDIGYAHAYSPDYGGSAWFNVTEPDLVNPVVGEYGFSTFIHEIGHALGLEHMGDYNGAGSWAPSSYQDSAVLSVMSYFGPRYAAALYSPEVMQADWTAANGLTYTPQTPMLNDVAAIQSIYGASTSTRLDNTVYGFSSTIGGATGAIYDFSRNAYPILTIYDSGGLDTLNFSGWSSPSRIDLQAGGFSSANSMTNNVAIAYTAVVENAVGGGGGDVISGNEVANRLEGGAGNDELYGKAGDDTLIGGAGNDLLDGGDGSLDVAVFDGNAAGYTISVAGSTVTLTGASGTDRATNVERFRFADITRTLSELVPGADSTAPLLQSVSPADNAGGLSIGANLVLTFNEAVRAGSGSITLFNADGSLFRSIAASDNLQLRFNGNTATIDPSVNLPGGQSFYVTIAAGSFADLAGNPYAGFSNAGTWNFSTSTTDSSAPQIVSLTPADDTTNVATGANLVINFDETVVAGSGNITITRSGQAGTTIAANDSARVTFSGNSVTINPSADFNPGSAYSVSIDSGAFRDGAGNAFAGLSDGSAWTFSTTAPIAGDDFPMSVETPGQLALTGSIVSARIDAANDGDMFKVNLSAGVTYRFDMLSPASSAVDPYLVLYGQQPDFVLIGYDDEGGSQRHDAQLFFTASSSGTYYVAASDNTGATGSYNISAAIPLDDYLASTATAGRLQTTGTIAFGLISAPTDSDMFALAIDPGAEVTIDLRSNGLVNPYLRLFDANGNVLAFDDDTGVDRNAQLTYSAPAGGGSYFVAASDFDTGMGSYKLTAIVRNVNNGSAGADSLNGSSSADTLNGLDGSDSLSGGAGDDILNGGNGIDSAQYAGPRGGYTLQQRADGWVVTHTAGTEGRDLLHGVERIEFADGKRAFDLDGNAGTVAKILGAVFGAASTHDPAYVGIGLSLADGGMSYEALLQLALDARLGSGAAAPALVDLLYTNLVGVAPSAAVLASYTGLLDDGTYTPVSLAMLAAEYELNLANIGMTGLIENGIGYL